MFRNKSDTCARTFENNRPGEDHVSRGFLYCSFLAADRDLNKAAYNLKNILTTCIQRDVDRVRSYKKLPGDGSRVLQ